MEFRKSSKIVQSVAVLIFINAATFLKAGEVKFVYADDLFYLPVIQQPADDPKFVSEELTQFSMASRYGNVGILAHNTVNGKMFEKLVPSQKIFVLYDMYFEVYVVDHIDMYQALEPSNPYGNLKDLSGSTMTAKEVFNKEYTGSKRLVFQTCLEKNGDLAWGRLFVTALPISTLSTTREAPRAR